MQRRSLLRLGFAAGALVAVGGGLIATLRPGWRGAQLTDEGREVMAAVSRAVVPVLAQADRASMDSQLSAIELLIATLPRPLQNELADLLALLCSAPGRWAVVGLRSDWAKANPAETSRALEDMRHSAIALRAQAYQALREVCLAAHHADPASWRELNYPGPLSVG
jgi:hypothetical protein